jgi:uncharacterized protein (DUF1697 family)
MTAYVALLRAVNVGGRKLIMSELKGIADELKLENARTYIASGNLLFRTGRSEASVKAMLEKAIGEHMGAEVPVMVRSATELTEVVKANPFPDGPQAKVAAIFLNAAPPCDAIDNAKNVANERMALGTREIYVAYPDGMGQSKLRIPAAKAGTARNMNTVAKLAELLREME